MARISGLAVAAMVAIAVVGPDAGATSSTTVSLVPVADATVSGAHNYTNYGSTHTLVVDGSPIVRSYLKFVVGGTSGSVSHAVLRLRALTSSPYGVRVAPVIGNGWTESTITFANAYAFGAALATSGPVVKGSIVSLDVSAFVKGGGTFSFVLSTAGKVSTSFGSRESWAPPALSVTVPTTLSSTATVTPSLLPTLVPSPTSSPTASPTPAPTTPAPTAAPTVSATPVTTVAPPPVTTTPHKLHIHHGFDLATPSQIAQHAALIDSRPLDGITVNLPTLSNDTLSGTAHSEAEYAAALTPMPTLQHVTHNFVVVRTMNPLSWYDDAQWSTIVSNFANLAQAARAKGQFDGIFLDTEFYGSGAYPWNFGAGSTPWTYSATAGATPGHTASDANAEVTGRGKQIGDAIAAAWPTAAVMSTYGPWVGETKTASTGGWGAFGYADTAWTNELMGSFTGGLVTAATAHPTMTYVDGGEVYQAHTPTEYATAYSWMRHGLAASGSPVVADPSTYDASVSAGFGVYDKDMRVSGWPTMDASLWQTVMTNALKTSDKYVWSYSEAYDWLGTGWPTTPVPADILTATANAMAAGA